MISGLSVPLHVFSRRHSITVANIFNYFFDPDNESDTEVPYADIMITVRGVSTPELTQVGYLSPGDQKEVRDKTLESLLSY